MKKKSSVNIPCPCGSGKKYKKCCKAYHSGAYPKNALLLMKSRYSAYALGLSRYIINTTHKDNPDYSVDTIKWINQIDTFCKETEFIKLEILDFIDGDKEAFVTFRAIFANGEMIEQSRFIFEDGKWLYHSGKFLN